MAIITLTTDFGMRDGYVGAMKGVILEVAPEARGVDISHEIGPQDVVEGAFVLASGCPSFPSDTIHVAVVDPGVGTERKGILVETARYVLIGPDNGLFSGVLAVDPLVRAVSLENRGLMRPDVSATFHGRDVFAPAAAHISRGVPVAEFGPEVACPVGLDLWQTGSASDCVTGHVVHVDRFGNCITGIGRADVEGQFGGAEPTVVAGGQRLGEIRRTYADVAQGKVLAYFGSLDTVEIAVNGGSAAVEFGLGRGEEICVER